MCERVDKGRMEELREEVGAGDSRQGKNGGTEWEWEGSGE